MTETKTERLTKEELIACAAQLLALFSLEEGEQYTRDELFERLSSFLDPLKEDAALLLDLVEKLIGRAEELNVHLMMGELNNVISGEVPLIEYSGGSPPGSETREEVLEWLDVSKRYRLQKIEEVDDGRN